MPWGIVTTYYPNRLAWSYTAGDQNVHLAAWDADGNPAVYDTIAACKAAGGRPYPGLLCNGPIGTCLISTTVAASGLEGDEAYYATGVINPPTVGEMDEVLGNNHQNISIATPFQTFWFRMTNNADKIWLNGRY